MWQLWLVITLILLAIWIVGTMAVSWMENEKMRKDPTYIPRSARSRR